MERYKNNLNESNKLSEFQKRFNNARQEVEHIVDKLGLGVDDNIKETVTLFRAMGFPTSSSCAGHTEKGEIGTPYIEIYSEAPNNWKEDEQKQAQWKAENEEYQKHMSHFLNDFYFGRTIPPDVKIGIRKVGMFGGFRISSFGVMMKAEELGIKSEEDAIRKIFQYQSEMAEFTKFLKQRLLVNE